MSEHEPGTVEHAEEWLDSAETFRITFAELIVNYARSCFEERAEALEHCAPEPDVSDAAFRSMVEAAGWQETSLPPREPTFRPAVPCQGGWRVAVKCADTGPVVPSAPTLAGARRKALALIAEREALRTPKGGSDA